MSIVLNVVSPTTSWIMSDGLVVDTNTGKIVDCSFQKFQPLHERLYVGYTGVRELASDVVSNFKRLYPHIETATIESSSYVFLEIIKEIKNKFDVTAQFLFTGISDSGNFASAVIRTDLSFEMFIPSSDGLRTVVLHNNGDPDLTNNILRYIQQGLKVDQAIQKGMTDTVNQVSEVDPSVNRTTFFKIIQK